MEGFGSWVRNLAMGRFATDPTVTAHVQAGNSLGSYFAAHRAQVADLLEVTPESIDLMDPKWSEMTEFVDEKGVRRSRTISEVAAWARHRPEFAKTRGANDKAFTLANEMSQMMGAVR